MLRVVEVSSFTPQPFTIIGWEVEDVDRAVAELEAAGVELVVFGGGDSPVWRAPNGDRVAWFHDSETNLVSVSQHVHDLG